MNKFLTQVFGTFEGNIQITLFSIWHIIWIVAIVLSPFIMYFILRKKSQHTKNVTLNVLAILVISIYILDFFLMPFSQGNIDIDKLPFHICTLTGIFIPFVQFNKKFESIKNVVVCFSIVSALMYITYPGSALGGISPFCYKIIQTFVYHGLVFTWGVLNLLLKTCKLQFKDIWKEAVGIVILIIWASIGNYAYSTSSHHYDWFFVTGSTFPFIPAWLMPFVVFVAVYAMCNIIYLISFVTYKYIDKHQNKEINLDINQ